MSTYAYGTERADELLDACAPVPSDWIGRYADPPELRRLELKARKGLRTLDDELKAGDTLCLWNLEDVWATLHQARQQLALWHTKGVTVKLLALNVTLGQNTPEMLRLLKGAQWNPPKLPKRERYLPPDVVPFIGYGWNVRPWRGGWQVAPDENAREQQGMIVGMHDEGLCMADIAVSLNLAKIRKLCRKTVPRAKTPKGKSSLVRIKSLPAVQLRKWTAQLVLRSYRKELELREFEYACASGGLSASLGKVATGGGWFTPPERTHQILCRHAQLYSRWHLRGRRSERDAALARAAGVAGDPEAAGGDDGADRARGPAEP